MPLIGNRNGWFGFDRARTASMANQSRSWTPLTLGSSLKTWVRADTVKGRTAAQFTAANSEKLTVADVANLKAGSGNLWLSGWVYCDTIAGDTDIAGKGAEYGFQLKTTNTVFQIEGFSAYALSGAQLSTGAWNHIFGYFDPGTDLVGISVNGAAFVTSAATGTITASAAAFGLGLSRASAYLDGRMGNWAFGKVYTEAVATIRTALYNSGNGLRFSDLSAAQKTDWGLQSWWELDEESGTRADKIGGNTLTDNNTVTSNDGKVAYAVTADGSVVYQGTDQGTAALAIVQATHTKKPLLKTSIINSQNVLRFDGTDDFLKVASGAISNQPLWGWVVVDDNDASTRYYLDGGAASKVSVFHDGTNLELNAGSAVEAAHTAGAPHLVLFIVNGASSDLRVDGASIATGDAGAQNQDSGVAVGADNAGATPLAGDIAEFAFVAGSPTAADLAGLKSYIATRYGLTIA